MGLEEPQDTTAGGGAAQQGMQASVEVKGGGGSNASAFTKSKTLNAQFDLL